MIRKQTTLAGPKQVERVSLTSLSKKTQNEPPQLEMASKDPKMFQKLADSIAPQVFGMSDVKKALLLAWSQCGHSVDVIKIIVARRFGGNFETGR